MKIAAVVYGEGHGPVVDELLATKSKFLRARAVKLAGAVQVNSPGRQASRCDMTLEDLASGRQIVASEDRGTFASGCRLDTAALECAVGLALSSLQQETDLVIVNRFGKSEAEGRGFRPLIEAAVELQIPVIVAVGQAHVPAWHAFSGGIAEVLKPEAGAIDAWCAAALAPRLTSRSGAPA